MNISFAWTNDDGSDGFLSEKSDVVPRVGETVNFTYQDDEDSPELTTVTGDVKSVTWDFDDTPGSPYLTVFLGPVTTRKWIP